MSMPSFIAFLVVGVLPLAAALGCLVGAIVAAERSRAPGRAIGVALPAAQLTAPVPARRTLRLSRPEPARIAGRAAMSAGPVSLSRA